MNWARGLFRLWVLFALAVFGATALFWYGPIGREFEKQRTIDGYKSSVVLLPVDCASARGVLVTDYFKDEKGELGPRDLCWMESPKFRKLYPEYNDMSDVDVSDKLYVKAGFALPPRPEPWHYVGVAALIGLGIPGAVLLIGVALHWALAGFKRA